MTLGLFPKRRVDQPTHLQNGDDQESQAKAKRAWLLAGVFGWGLGVFVAMTIGDFIGNPKITHSSADTMFVIALNCLIWPIAGYCWGYWMWRSGSRAPKFWQKF